MALLRSARLTDMLLIAALLVALLPGVVAVPTTHASRLRNLPNVSPDGIITGPANSLWFAETGAIGRLSPEGVITSFALPHHAHDHPTGLTVGPDGAIWFTLANNIGRLTAKGKFTIVLFSPLAPGDLSNIISGPGKRLWFIDTEGNFGHLLYSMTPDFLFRPVPTDKAIDPEDIIAGHDGAVWFLESLNNPAFPMDPIIGQITATGHVKLFPVPPAIFAHSTRNCDQGVCTPLALTQTADGAIWFPVLANAIGRLSPKGTLSSFPLMPAPGQIPRPCSQGAPLRITHDGHGNIWYGQMTFACIGRLTPTGVVTTNVSADRLDNIGGLVADAQGNIWFTLPCVNSVGRLALDGHVTTYHIPHTAADAGQACPETL